MAQSEKKNKWSARVIRKYVLLQLPGIAVFALNRPEAKNAFSPEMISLWRQHLEEARNDSAVRVVVVTGKGDTFCSGGDIRDMAEGKLRVVGHEELPLGGGSPDRAHPGRPR